jgi:hypothetical protein
MKSVKGYSHIPPELIARLEAEFPDLWDNRPDIMFGFAFGPPEGVGLSWVEQFVVKDEVAELLSDPSISEAFFERLAAASYSPALAISDKLVETNKRLRHAFKKKDHETILRIMAERWGPYEKEKGR